MNWLYETVKGPPEEAEEFFKEVKEMKELLLFALQMERASQIFYHQAAERLEDKKLVDLLKKLSQAEGKHRKVLYASDYSQWTQLE